jgi:hypothetical protein
MEVMSLRPSHVAGSLKRKVLLGPRISFQAPDHMAASKINVQGGTWRLFTTRLYLLSSPNQQLAVRFLAFNYPIGR